MSSSSSGEDYDQEDMEEEQEGYSNKGEASQSLFDQTKYSNVYETVSYDWQNYGFDLLKFIEKCNNTEWNDEIYMIPVLENDGLLFFDYEEALQKSNSGQKKPQELSLQVQQLESTILQLQDVVQQQRNLIQDLVGEDDKTFNNTSTSRNQQSNFSKGINTQTQLKQDQSYFESYDIEMHRQMLEDQLGMESQLPRTSAYQNAILKNQQLFEGKKVIDLGSGSGILSLFALQAGAREVIGFEANKNIAQIAQKVADHNIQKLNLKGSCKFISMKIENCEPPQNDFDKVDILISEWMGYGLFFESMLQSVLYAKHKWLKPNGVVLPDRGSIYIAATLQQEKKTFWQDVYGFDMSLFHINQSQKQSSYLPQVVSIKEDDLMSKGVKVTEFDFDQMQDNKIYFTKDFNLELDLFRKMQNNQDATIQDKQTIQNLKLQTSNKTKKDSITLVSGLTLWFDIEFSEKYCKQCQQILSTSPSNPQTHWYQLYLPLKESIILKDNQMNSLDQNIIQLDSQQTSMDSNTQFFGNQSMQNSFIQGNIRVQIHPEQSRGLLITINYRVYNVDGNNGNDNYQQFEMLPNE